MKLDPSFDAFVVTGSPGLLRSAYLLTGDRDLAEDLIQVALIRTARRWHVAQRSPAAYAHQVLVNLLHDRRRNLNRRVHEEPLPDAFEDLGVATDGSLDVIERLAIIEALQQLPDRQREVIVLRFFADLSIAQTAAAIGSSEGTVKTHTTRALIGLRARLAPDAMPSEKEV